MREYNRRAAEAGIPPEQMYATEGDLMHASGEAAVSGPEYYGFDLALISLALHHLDDPVRGVKLLVERLKKGGVLVILDWMPAEGAHAHQGGGPGCGGHGHHHGSGHGKGFAGGHGDGSGNEHAAPSRSGEDPHYSAAMDTVHQDGFSKENIEEIFAAVGVTDVGFYVIEKQLPFGRRGLRTLLMAKGRRID